MGSSTPLIFLAGVLMGSGSAISSKVLYGLSAVGDSGKAQYFEKPLVLTFVMFVSMTLALPMHWAKRWYDGLFARGGKIAMQISGASTPILGVGSGGGGGGGSGLGLPETSATNWRTLFLLLVPAGFDLLATALSAAGLMYTTVSVSQLIRCSVMIVTALLKATILRQKVKSFQWVGVIICTIATILVSIVSLMPDHNEQQPGPYRDPRVGVVLILLSCVVQGSQYVFEEKLMTEENAAPLLVVGMEGVWGVLIMVLIVFPWAQMLPGSDQGGCLENLPDSWTMVQNSDTIRCMLMVFFTSVFLYNIFAIYVTYLLCSVWHAILENFRPGAVWTLDLLLYYWVTQRSFGEAWTKWSWLQLAGMCVMIAGTAIYNASIELPGFEYPPVQMLQEPPERVIFSSDAIASSPLISKGARAERRLSAIQNLMLDEECGTEGDHGTGHPHHELGMHNRGYGGVGTYARQTPRAGPKGEAQSQLLVPSQSQPFVHAFSSSSAPSSPQKTPGSHVSFSGGSSGGKLKKQSSRAKQHGGPGGAGANANSEL